MKKFIILLFVSYLFSLPGSSAEYADLSKVIQPGKWLRNIHVKTEFEGDASYAIVQIFFPKDYTKNKNYKTLIALHQYGANEKDWEANASIEFFANKYRFVIVCPRMDKSLYETAYYPETLYKWNVIPGGKYVGETLIKFLSDNFALARNRESTGIIGVTVGAHGAVLIAAKYPDKFGACAGISGYYDVISMQNSHMIESIYGSYKNNPQRWENDDNPLKIAENLKGIHVYLYHGIRSDAFQTAQSQIMAIKIKQLEKKSPGYNIIYKDNKNGYYGWLYWKGQLPQIMEFMDYNLKN